MKNNPKIMNKDLDLLLLLLLITLGLANIVHNAIKSHVTSHGMPYELSISLDIPATR